MSTSQQKEQQNILFLAHRVPYPPNKGEKIRTFNQIKYLADNGHKIGVFAPQESQQDHQYIDFLEENYCELTSAIAPTSTLKLAKGLMQNQPLSVANFYSKPLQKAFDKYLKTHTIDTIICTSSCMAEYIYRSSVLKQMEGNLAQKRPKLIMDFMDLDSDKWQQYKKLKRFPLSCIYSREATLLRRYEDKIYHSFDHSFFISQEEVKLFLNGDKSNGKLLAIANGIDTDYFQPSAVKENLNAPILLFTGVMDYLPNEDAVLWFCEQIWPNVLKIWPDAQFIIAGMNPSPAIKALANHSGVEVTGFVDDIRVYYERADFFVAPFRLARGVQNKVLQAFACGLPVISTPIGNEGIDAKDGQEILIAEDEKAFIAQIKQLSHEFALRKSISDNALALVQQSFSWRGQLEKLEQLIKAA